MTEVSFIIWKGCDCCMQSRWMKRRNDNGQEERFYPITHADAVVDLDTKIQENVESVTDSLSSHIENTDVHFTTVERTKLSGIATGAEVNQNAFSNVKVGTTTIAADAKTDTIEFVGSNVTITPNATNDKVTFAVADGSTSAKGVVQLTNSTSSTSTTTAATPNSVKSAYDLANTANTKATNAQTTADGKSDKGHKHIISEITDLTATATELNYMDGVTSAVQTQLNSKLGKTTYEYNMELSMGGSGYVCIGKFPMYDSNVSVEIKSTTNTTYHGTLIIASQNINTTGGGTYTAKIYGDADNSLTGSIKIHYGSGSNVFSVYAALPTWSKNLLHIQCANLPSAPSDIVTSVSSIPSNATIVPTNALKVQLDTKANKSDIPTLSSLGITATATELNYVDGVTSNIQTQLDGKAASSHNHAASNITSGTLGVARGGTGATTFTSGAALIGAGTGAVKTRGITSLTANTTSLTGTNLVTADTVRYMLNRSESVNQAHTGYTSYIARGIAANTTALTSGSSALTNGCIYLQYE